MENFNDYLQGLDMDVFRRCCEEHGEVVTFSPGEHFATRDNVGRRVGIHP